MQSRGDLGAGIALTSPEIILIITLMIMMIVVIMKNIMPMSVMNLEHNFRDPGLKLILSVMMIRFLNTLMMIGRSRINLPSHKAKIKLDIVAQRVHPPYF